MDFDRLLRLAQSIWYTSALFVPSGPNRCVFPVLVYVDRGAGIIVNRRHSTKLVDIMKNDIDCDTASPLYKLSSCGRPLDGLCDLSTDLHRVIRASIPRVDLAHGCEIEAWNWRFKFGDNAPRNQVGLRAVHSATCAGNYV